MNIESRLNPHFVKLYGEKIHKESEVKVVRARDILLRPNRFDLLLKYVTVEAIERKYFGSFYQDLFYQQVSCMTNGEFKEGDGFKNSYDDFLSSFKDLINSMRERGYDHDNFLIPVNEKGDCLDGAHRVAVAAYFDLDVHTVLVEGNSVKYTYSFFQENGMDPKFLDFAAQKAIELNKNSFIVNLHSVAKGKTREVQKIISEYANILYCKELRVTEDAYKWILYNSYKNESWIGSKNNSLRGAVSNAKYYVGRDPLRVFVLDCKSYSDVLKIKEKIRNLYSIKNYSVHATDTHEEAKDLARLFFNQNNIEFMLKSKLLNRRYFKNLFSDIVEFKLFALRNNIDLEKIIVDGSTVMGLYGLRETRDIDYVTIEKDPPLSKKYDNHASFLLYHKLNLEDLLFDPANYMYFEGVKILSLKQLYEFKHNRDEHPKDIDDLRLIRMLVQPNIRDLFVSFTSGVKLKGRSLKKISKRFLKDLFLLVFPKGSPVYRAVKSLVFSRRRKNADEPLIPSFDLTKDRIEYFSYNLFFERGTSIVWRYLTTGSYEKDEVEFIRSYLSMVDSKKCMLDIGANIGMISLAALSFFDDLKVYAFEPGPSQFKYLKKNACENNLDTRLIPYDFAVSDSVGEAEFSVHSPEHSSGDGFKDTGRAGSSGQISVKTTTLDQWYQEEKAKVDLIKIDVEGAELMVLRGARKLISEEKPAILFEVHCKNLKGYDFDHYDLFSFLNENGYKIYNLNMSEISKNQLDRLTEDEDYGADFVALHYEKN